MLFEKQHIGNPISSKLAKYLRDWTNSENTADVSSKTKVSVSTIRDVIERKNELTEQNSIAIIELMKLAVINCTKKVSYAVKAKKGIENSL